MCDRYRRPLHSAHFSFAISDVRNACLHSHVSRFTTLANPPEREGLSDVKKKGDRSLFTSAQISNADPVVQKAIRREKFYFDLVCVRCSKVRNRTRDGRVMN
jgi:hypothetical protein